MLADRGSASPQLERGPQLSGIGDATSLHRTRIAGDRVGSYRLERELGRGGMSVVWLAQREHAESSSQVALKLPAVSLDGEAFLARFAREREFLERLDHPGIARLIDAGVTETGQHYLALEFVDGLPLNVHCDAARLGVRARLALFLHVLEAVQHAHSRSILHRDLKPSNILVTRAGEVRLLDFGIAKLLVDGRADETEMTALWGRALTRDYASPEQFAGQTVTARSDIYALGVLLYDLVCGQRPYRTSAGRRHPSDATGGVLELLPPSESCRPDSVVAACEGGPKALARRLAGGIDAIALRALQHDAADRYPDVAAMAADVARVLAREPVGSRLGRGWFRGAALLRRHRSSISTSSLLLLAIGGLGHSHQLAADIEAILTPAVPQALQTVLVSIGPDDYQRVFKGSSPLDAATLQRLVSRIVAGGPAAVGVDIDTAAASFQPLRSALDAAALSRVVWARDIAASDQAQAMPVPRPVLGGASGAAPVRSGLAVSLVEGSTGAVRWWRRAVPTADGAVPSFAAELVRGLRPEGIDESESATALRSVWFKRSERLDVPASVVLADGFVWGDRLRDRVVLLGGRYDRTDVHPTAIGLMHGVEIVANIVETERTGRSYPRPGLFAVLLIGLVDLAAAIVLFERLRGAAAGAASLGFGLALAAALAAAGVFPAWPYAVMAALAVVLNQSVRLQLRRQRERLLRAFQRLRRLVA